MKIPVTIEFSSPGLQPPVFVSSSLNGWQPTEMECTKSEHGRYSFSKTFTAEEGEYQYKLRLGPGDWWICDTTKPRVDDGAGNENNLVVVEPKSHTLYAADEREPHPQEEYQHDEPPMMKHEAFTTGHTTHGAHGHHDIDHADHDHLTPDHHVASPLFRHESIAPTPQHHAHPHDYNEHWPEDAPLLRHESIAPSSHEQSHSPLFGHESTAIDNKGDHDVRHHIPPMHLGQQRRGSLGERTGSNRSIPEEADPDDPSLEKFPTDHVGIMEHLDRVRRASDSGSERSSSRSPSNSAVASASPMLPAVKEGEEEEDLEDLKDGAGDKPQTHTQEHLDRPAAPITPPMTPKSEDSKDKDDSPLGIREQADAVKKSLKEVHVQEKLDQAKSLIDQHTPVVIEKAQQAQQVIQDNVPQSVIDKAQQAQQAVQDSVPVVKDKVQQAKDVVVESGNKGLGLLAIGLGIAMAIGSAALAFWLIKTKSEDVVAGL